ncbi:MAG: amidohydrolase family protein [Arenimonas sp.]|uniref:amidohydrolase family protein n=1 Tax=Arenimonas sp. TaxID=1872635 RepID=UPI0025C49BAB|nr:amidohydrolase family protein [Arenimonas sp.]MBW8369044.1 amidohydrolase family protein [Arenimonas sp.]
MRFASGMAVLLLIPGLALAATTEEKFSVVTGGNKVGHLVARHDGDRVTIEFDVKNNGRGPTIAETLQLDAGGLPTQWTITGATTFGSKVDERFALADGQAAWKDSVGEGSAKVTEPSLYIGQAASPWSLGLYARVLLKDANRTLPALPGGEVRVVVGEPLSVTDGKQAITVRVHAVSGLEYAPDYVLLDEKQALFAVVSPGSVVVREGFEGEQVRLRQMAADLSTQRLEQIQKLTAHRYGAPVRFRNVRIFDPQELALSAPVSVVINGRHISSIQSIDSAVSPGEVLVEGEGGTLVAGLYEMHGHTGQEGALLNVAAGVTTVRDMGNDNAVLDALIARIEAGAIGGPRIHRSGFIEGKSPFNSNNGILVDSEAETLAAVRWYAARGYGQVKLYNSMKPEWSAIAATEAHRLGLRVAGHVPAFSNADAMVDAGYDELTHINQIALGWVIKPEEDTRTLFRLTALKRLATLDLQSAPVQRTLAHIADRKVAVEPTIAIHENLLLNRGGAVPQGAVDYIDNLPVGEQRSARQGWADMSAPGDAEAYAVAYTKLMDTLRQMRERGILLIPGTDLGGSFTFHRELELFNQLGYTPAEVLRLATWDMAMYLGQNQSTGSIEKGKLADFFLVPGDPTADLKAIKTIRAVVKDGTVYYPSEIYPHFGIKPFATAPKVTLP